MRQTSEDQPGINPGDFRGPYTCFSALKEGDWFIFSGEIKSRKPALVAKIYVKVRSGNGFGWTCLGGKPGNTDLWEGDSFDVLQLEKPKWIPTR